MNALLRVLLWPFRGGELARKMRAESAEAMERAWREDRESALQRDRIAREKRS